MLALRLERSTIENIGNLFCFASPCLFNCGCKTVSYLVYDPFFPRVKLPFLKYQKKALSLFPSVAHFLIHRDVAKRTQRNLAALVFGLLFCPFVKIRPHVHLRYLACSCSPFSSARLFVLNFCPFALSAIFSITFCFFLL
jgi:hypothetical protein